MRTSSIAEFVWILAIAFISIACGSPLPKSDPVGSLSSPIYMPNGYGADVSSNGLRCGNPFGGGRCLVPDSKTIDIKFYASTCSSWWQARFVEVWWEYEAILASMNEWQLVSTSNFKHTWRCGNVSGGLGHTALLSEGAEDHETPRGILRQIKKTNLRIDSADMESSANWEAADDSERQRKARRTIRHEVAHELGFGHLEGEGPNLMNQGGDGSEWDVEHGLSTAELVWMSCYNQDSGSSDDC